MRKRSIVNSGQRQRRRHATQWLAIGAVGLAVAVYAALCTPSLAADWNQIVASAKREGKITIFGPPGADNRDALVLGFQKRYPEIEVDLNAARGTPNAHKLVTERSANYKNADLYIGPVNTIFQILLPFKALQPMPDFLVGPQINPSSWLGGKLEYSDETKKFNVVFNSGPVTPFVYNPTLVPQDAITSLKDLLDPKWKGKIVMFDSRTGGSGQNNVTFWYIHKDLGKEFIRRFFTESGVVISRNSRQMLEWIARGQYMIGVGGSSSLSRQMEKKGAGSIGTPKSTHHL